MKFRKKTVMLLSFTLGTLLVATTAFADLANKSGYDRLKDSFKVTADYLSEKADSFTMDMTVEIKENGNLLASENATEKYDRTLGASESTSSSLNFDGGKYNYYSYSDKKTDIHTSNGDSTYYVTEYSKERNNVYMENPFKEEEAEDIEKIADALVGNLKDYVVASENSDGSFDLQGSLTEAQIPALVNAVTSFAFKQEINGNQDNLPRLAKDVYVKEVKGTATVDKDGILENIFGGAVLTGADEQGTVHDISVEVLVKFSDLNSTQVVKPDLTGKQVVTNTATEDGPDFNIPNPEKFVGTFKNDIVIEQAGKFVKVGERVLVIEQADNQTITGRYSEEYKSEFAEYAGNEQEFSFTAEKRHEDYSSDYELLTDSGMRGNIYLDEHSAKIHFNLNKAIMGNQIYDSIFSPVLD